MKVPRLALKHFRGRLSIGPRFGPLTNLLALDGEPNQSVWAGPADARRINRAVSHDPTVASV